ncbi:MAG: hypothetical protein COA44_15230 [Arcobacter sp.]|nr:MAG: hypothetical protein COA44_15230 [Arcobacter sp.]
MDKYFKKFEQNKVIKIIVTYLQSYKDNQSALKNLKWLGFSLLILLITLLIIHLLYSGNPFENGNLKTLASIVAPLAILISALIASYSVMLNIENTKAMEKERNKRIKLRNLSILKMDVSSIIKDVDEQIEVLTCTLQNINSFKYSEMQIKERFFRVAEKMTSTEINEYSSQELLERISAVQKVIYDKIHVFSILFQMIEETSITKIDEDIRIIIEYFSRTYVEEGMQTDTVENENKLWHKITSHEKFSTFNIDKETSSKILKKSNEVNIIIKDMKKGFLSDKIELQELHKTLQNEIDLTSSDLM